MTNVATGDNSKLPGVGDSVGPLFVIGNSEQNGLIKSSRISAKSHIPAHLSSPLAPKITRANDSASKRAKPKVYGTVRPSRKLDNTPVPQAVPLAFPASTNFNFRALDLDEPPLLSTSNKKPPVRAIQILPTEVLVLVIQWIDPSRHHPILKTMSLVNQTLNTSIAPLLYHRLRLFNLREVYDFSLYFRHPVCVTSLDMFITPDPNDIGWLPQNPTWTEQFGNMLAAMTRLMSLRINRCDASSALSAITARAGDSSFLPALQKLSFGQWHELSCLAPTRYIISYGLTFTLHASQDYDKLEQILVTLKQHGRTIRDLSLTAIIALKPDFVMKQAIDYRKSILHVVMKHMPELHTMVLRTQCQTDARLYALPHKAADILALIPQRMPNLESLEIYDPRSPQYRSADIIKAASELSQEQGPCPMLHSISLDGLLWKRAPSQLSSIAGVSLYLSTLTLDEKPGASALVRSLEQRKPHVFAPKVTWSPCPSNSRGRMWWARRVSELHATSKSQAVFLLRQWMLQYWDHRHVMNDDNQLERAIAGI